MFVKVCGINDANSYLQLYENPEIAFLGSIFYVKSKRFTDASFVKPSPKNVAVFVNQTEAEIREIALRFGFKNIQLHGEETVDLCVSLKKDFTVIKAFGIDLSFDFETLASYENAVDYFLFDTKTELHGGSGRKFNWEILRTYTGKKPFVLSGGIQPDDAEKLLHLQHPSLAGIDINSGFELEPGVKNKTAIHAFIQKLKNT